jgi:membrane-associated phospholipid phosphatase
MKQILPVIAKTISIVFHPLLIPTYGFLLLSNSGAYEALLPWDLTKLLLLVVFFTTAVLPALTILLLSFHPKFDLTMENSNDRVLPLLISSVSYYIGYLIIERISFFPVFNLLLIAAILIQIGLAFISMRWKISAHTAAIGGLIGGVAGLSFRLYSNPSLTISLMVIIAGLIGTSRLMLEKHTPKQIYAGFMVGFITMGLLILMV